MKGKFITFEGCEGVGKSHQIKRLIEYLNNNKVDFYFTREPGGTSISEQIRKIILDGNKTAMTDECEALLYASARAQLVKEEILPRLNNGQLVICDRYIDSSFAYQSYARGLDMQFVESINQVAIKNCLPTLTLFLDLPPIEAFKRKGGADNTDRVELSGIDFHNKVYNGYCSLAEKYSDRIVKIDASGTREQTHSKIINVLKDKGII